MMDYSVFPTNQAPVFLSTTLLFNCLVLFVVFLQAPQFTSSDTGPIVFSEGNHNWTHLQTYIGYTNDPWGESAPELSQHSSALSESTRHNVSYRGKRSVVHLYNIIVCATDCNPLAYKGYGCYCGFLGSGYSMDPIDSCCKMHDWCYTTADCPMFLEYFVPYVWTCYRRRPLCGCINGSMKK
ncbi:hypothetical protein LSTR_LSTR002643 [Laodelphax striatellus]|uniref:Phospholipase A2 n=1 Tax=Laodelphax striatellus TaxID=195883 RepID=A0A482XMP7_LAOST|nr:hypothetical protein LSTR_LSTR002643 [Laodelphax striatellus]